MFGNCGESEIFDEQIEARWINKSALLRVAFKCKNKQFHTTKQNKNKAKHSIAKQSKKKEKRKK